MEKDIICPCQGHQLQVPKVIVGWALACEGRSLCSKFWSFYPKRCSTPKGWRANQHRLCGWEASNEYHSHPRRIDFTVVFHTCWNVLQLWLLLAQVSRAIPSTGSTPSKEDYHAENLGQDSHCWPENAFHPHHPTLPKESGWRKIGRGHNFPAQVWRRSRDRKGSTKK